MGGIQFRKCTQLYTIIHILRNCVRFPNMAFKLL